MNCHSCGSRLSGPIVECSFSGFPGAGALNGVTMTLHARCIRLVIPDRGIALPERISDPVAEPDMVNVYANDGRWWVFCRECGRVVATKDNRDDAELGAARHLARRHQEVAV